MAPGSRLHTSALRRELRTTMMPAAVHLDSRDHYIDNTDPGGEIGRRSGLKTRGYTACGFESRPGYQSHERRRVAPASANGGSARTGAA